MCTHQTSRTVIHLTSNKMSGYMGHHLIGLVFFPFEYLSWSLLDARTKAIPFLVLPVQTVTLRIALLLRLVSLVGDTRFMSSPPSSPCYRMKTPSNNTVQLRPLVYHPEKPSARADEYKIWGCLEQLCLLTSTTSSHTLYTHLPCAPPLSFLSLSLAGP